MGSEELRVGVILNPFCLCLPKEPTLMFKKLNIRLRTWPHEVSHLMILLKRSIYTKGRFEIIDKILKF